MNVMSIVRVETMRRTDLSAIREIMKVLIAIFVLAAVAFAANPEPQGCCFPHQYETFIHTWNPVEEHFTRDRQFYDFVNKNNRLDVHTFMRGEEVIFTILDRWAEGKRYLINDKTKHCDLEKLPSTTMPQECIRPGRHDHDFYIGGTLEVQRWAHDYEGDIFVSTTTKKDCVPVGMVFTKVKQLNMTQIIEYEDFVPQIKDPNIFNPPSFCPT